MSTAQKMARRIQQYVWSLVVVVMCAPLTSAVTISAQAANKKMDGTSVFGTAATTSFPLHAFDCLWLHAFDGNAENSWTNNFSSCVCLCVCLYVCMHVCPCDCEQTYVCWMNVCLFVCYVCMYVYLQICVWVLKHNSYPHPRHTYANTHTHMNECKFIHSAILHELHHCTNSYFQHNGDLCLPLYCFQLLESLSCPLPLCVYKPSYTQRLGGRLRGMNQYRIHTLTNWIGWWCFH